jgi:hypothetical protein
VGGVLEHDLQSWLLIDELPNALTTEDTEEHRGNLDFHKVSSEEVPDLQLSDKRIPSCSR